MREKKRYATVAIVEEVGVDIQRLLWEMLDDRIEQGHTLDYLQVFDLSVISINGQAMQRVCNWQEQPCLQIESVTTQIDTTQIESPIQTTIWIIDDGDCYTMLYPYEY
ncbi:DUF960 family protein [Brevibacillus brevis]|uniref:DUF960 family protein n=1 Tax=Brevibacillus brevis TaxID=1393 RepID=UPI000D10EE57|nr:DUF960 family protein [Brevibacillus brevis]PSJ63557.1 hypothetical protein C7J99_31355 [Brevibacillus brevis]RED33836.1 uncharacterized protein DUF960 [Brevibacillus brevis]GEC93327.1 hypothetical protein BBR01nite_56580 [Brevibacillus brevis]VEF92594.1 Staphylococcal protein of uncharacterised function (DUF960) [Brevibacillus brevis]